jgi:hypothetical protein
VKNSRLICGDLAFGGEGKREKSQNLKVLANNPAFQNVLLHTRSHFVSTPSPLLPCPANQMSKSETRPEAAMSAYVLID